MTIENLINYVVLEGTGSLLAHLGYGALSTLKSKKQSGKQANTEAIGLLNEIELIRKGAVNDLIDEDLDKIERKSKRFLGGAGVFCLYAMLRLESELFYNYFKFFIGGNHPGFIEVNLNHQDNGNVTKTIKLFYDNSIKSAEFPLNGQTRESLAGSVHYLRTMYRLPIGFNE